MQERTGGREPTEYYRYYSTQRHIDLGAFPKPPDNAPVENINFDKRRMAEAGITNVGAYMRKMALNGYILHVDLAPVKELVSLQRRCANNLNQVAVHANTFGVYPEEIAGSSGTMKSSVAGCPMCSCSCLHWWRNDLEGCGLSRLHPSLFSFTIYIFVEENVIHEARPPCK